MWEDAVAAVLVDRFWSFLQSKVCQFYEFEDQFQELKNEICYIQSFLEDANNVKPEHKTKILKTVMADLRELVYDAEEITEDYELHLDKVGSRKISKLFSGSCASSLNPLNQMGKRLGKITQGMTKVRERMTGYLVPSIGLRSHKQETVQKPLRYPMLLDKDEIVGLDVHSSNIKQWILDRNEPLTVIGIVGMGGIGKTTLAQKIKHDAKDYFGIKLFVTVSRTFRFEALLKNILVKLDVEEASLRGDAHDLLEKLKIKLDREYLIVLDDVWDTDEGFWWESLKSGLPKVHRSCVIVTARKEEVAKSMGAVEERIHRPNLLSDDESWSLFSKVAFHRHGGTCPDPSLEDIGRKIVSKCGRLPLAIKIIGGMIVANGNSTHRWQQTLQQLEQGLASSRKESKDGLLISTLELSYEDLPAHLKPCLLSFSMLPEDYECRMLEMVYWWIGEGFVWERDGRTALDIGEEYYEELLSRCLRIGEKKDDLGEKYISCRMHDIDHETTRKIAREENFLGFRHGNRDMSIAPQRRFRMADKLKVWTLAVEGDDWESFTSSLGKACCRLRVLEICLCMDRFLQRNCLDRICTLHHLKYLRLDFSSVAVLPDTLGGLRNLRVLVLVSDSLYKLPPSIATLQKLIILDIDAPFLKSMPNGLGKLSNLEKLWGYRTPDGRLKEGSCWDVELKKLTKLRKLDIAVNRCDEIEGALKVLAALPLLEDLRVEFPDVRGNTEMVRKVADLQLPPFHHLEKLHILRYPVAFPRLLVPAWLDPGTLPKLRLPTFEIAQWTIQGNRRLFSEIQNAIPGALLYLACPQLRTPLH